MMNRETAHLNGKLSLLLPAYNEGKEIYENALKAAAQVEQLADAYEVIVISDGSTDDTVEQVKKAAVENPHIVVQYYDQNMGKGQALREGTQHATGDYIAFCDADMDIAPSQLAGFIELLQAGNADVVIGSKMHKDSKVDYPFARHIYSWGYYLLMLMLFQLNTKDTQTGLKLFRADVIKPVMKQVLVKRFAFDIEVLSIINNRGFKIVSAPVQVIFHRTALGRIGFTEIVNIFVDTLAVFYRLRILHYYDRLPEEKKENTEAVM